MIAHPRTDLILLLHRRNSASQQFAVSVGSRSAQVEGRVVIDWIVRVLVASGASVAGLFVSKDQSQFDVIAAMTAIMLLAAFLGLLVYEHP